MMDDHVKKQLQQLSKQSKVAQEKALLEKVAVEEPKELSFVAKMKDVKPLKPNNQREREQVNEPIRRRRDVLEEKSESNLFYIGQSATEDEAPRQFSKFGQGLKDIKKLQSGKLKIVSTLDLHGYAQEEAQITLNEFIEYVQERGVCASIVHGSGLGSKGFSPVLKRLVRHWLMAHPDVLAYCEINNNDGAVSILVKRKYPEDPFSESK